ncbi:uncharacterized protein [Rutidosis leptorrhynchoides]|uniref:uncharacterized protein n=1 Tax=Rutidosis leptorrhynchoides TaxID=125765 RepID=UPI003A9A1A25
MGKDFSQPSFRCTSAGCLTKTGKDFLAASSQVTSATDGLVTICYIDTWTTYDPSGGIIERNKSNSVLLSIAQTQHLKITCEVIKNMYDDGWLPFNFSNLQKFELLHTGFTDIVIPVEANCLCRKPVSVDTDHTAVAVSWLFSTKLILQKICLFLQHKSYWETRIVFRIGEGGEFSVNELEIRQRYIYTRELTHRDKSLHAQIPSCLHTLYCSRFIDIFVRELLNWCWNLSVHLSNYSELILFGASSCGAFKSEDQWTAAKSITSTANIKAVSSIQYAICPSVFKIIQNIETAKESWDALQLMYEGTKSVRQSKLHLITTRFETLTMKVDETITDFEKKLRYIANKSTAHSEEIPDSKLVRKVLISLPDKFSSKMEAISESTDFENLQFDDLMGKFRTHEMTLAMKKRDKSRSKTVASKSGIKEVPVNTGDQQPIYEQLVPLMKNMRKMYRKFNKAKFNDDSLTNQKNNQSSQKKETGGGSQRYGQGKSSEGKTRVKIEKIKCHECQGFGHIAAKCASTLEEQEKSFLSTWSDEETSEDKFKSNECGREIKFHAHTALTATVSVSTDNSKENLSTYEDSGSEDDGDIHAAFKDLLGKMTESLRINHILSDELTQLTAERKDFDKIIEKYETEIDKLKYELSESEKKLEQANLAIEKFTKGKGNLDEILNKVSPKDNLFGGGYTPSRAEKEAVIMTGTRQTNNTYTLNGDIKCLKTNTENLKLWHKKLGHIDFRNLVDLSKTGYVKGLPPLTYDSNITCGDCQLGKQTKQKHSKVHYITTERPLQLLHINLMGPMQTPSLGGKTYVFVCVDDFSRYTWVDFLKEKSEAPDVIIKLCNKLNNERQNTTGAITRIRSDHGKEFENSVTTAFCEHSGFVHEFSAPITPQQNGVVERKNRFITELAHTMIHARQLSYKLLGKAMSMARYTINRVYLQLHTKETPYEILRNKKQSMQYLHEFGSSCYMLMDREPRRKLDSKSEREVFVGHSVYRTLIDKSNTITESINVVVNDKQVEMENQEDGEPGFSQLLTNDNTPSVGALGTEGVNSNENTPSVEALPVSTDARNTHKSIPAITNQNEYPTIREQKNHPTEDIIGDIFERQARGVLRENSRGMINYVTYTSRIEPQKVDEALTNEQGNITRNKARLFAQVYRQVEGIDFGETFAPVTQLESIRLSIIVVTHGNITLYQMDVKHVLLKGYLNTKEYPYHEYRLTKALYGLKPAPQAWYGGLSVYLCQQGYRRGGVDNSLFLKTTGGELIIAQTYVDDNIFCPVSKEETSITQKTCAKNLVKKYGLGTAKPIRMSMRTNEHVSKDTEGESANPTLYQSMIESLLYLCASRLDLSYIWYTKDTNGVLAGYSDADMGGCVDDRRSTSGGCFYLGNNLVS